MKLHLSSLVFVILAGGTIKIKACNLFANANMSFSNWEYNEQASGHAKVSVSRCFNSRDNTNELLSWSAALDLTAYIQLKVCLT